MPSIRHLLLSLALSRHLPSLCLGSAIPSDEVHARDSQEDPNKADFDLTDSVIADVLNGNTKMRARSSSDDDEASNTLLAARKDLNVMEVFIAGKGSKVGPARKALKQYSDSDQKCAAAKHHAKLKLLKTRDPDKTPSKLLRLAIGTAVAEMGAEIWHQFTANANIVGTDGICGCTAVAIVGTTGAVVAHISPNLETSPEQFRRMKQLFDDNLKGKPLLRAIVWSPISDLDGIKYFQEAVAKVTEKIVGHDIQHYFYDMAVNGRPDDYKWGTIAVLKDAGPPQVFLNDISV